MARVPNKVNTEEVKIRTTPRAVRYLDQIVETGLYGKSRSEAAERLVARGIEQLIREGTFEIKPEDGN